MSQPQRLDGLYDYIVVGAGSAGCVVANRLSADPTKKVLLLEAGGNDDWIWLHIPVGYLFAIGNPRCDWMFQTEPEPGLNGRSLKYPRGKVVGGSSAINAMISMRGQRQDYDHWRQLGLPGWSAADVFPLFKRLDNHFLGDTEHHGSSGEWRVEEPRLRWDVLDAVHAAAVQMSIPASPDFNTGNNEGVGYFHVNQQAGIRWSAARGFLKPVLNRPNLRLVTHAAVDKLVFEGRHAKGVHYIAGQESKCRDGQEPECHERRSAGVAGRRSARAAAGEQRFEARAAREIVLCSGSIGSVEILQRSGVGDPTLLQSLGIPVVLDRKGVGQNLQDHLQQRMIYKVSGVKTLNETYHSLFGRALMGMQYALFRRGPLTMAPSQLGIFTRSDPSQPRANIQFHVQPLSLDKFGDPLHRFPAVTVSACNLRPTSRGSVRIRSADMRDKPEIRPNYLSTHEDRKVAADAIRVTRRLMQQPALARFQPTEHMPGADVADNDEALAKAAGDIGTTIFHPVGTAKMGVSSDPHAVVDERLRVHGLAGLRIVDASVMPTITSGNTNTPTVMIAENGSRFIIEDARVNECRIEVRSTVPEADEIAV